MTSSGLSSSAGLTCQHFAVERHVHAAGGFHRFHGGGFGAFFVSLQFRQLHEHHVAQGVLRESGDADSNAAVSFGAQPFVIFSKTQLAHGNSSGGQTRLVDAVE